MQSRPIFLAVDAGGNRWRKRVGQAVEDDLAGAQANYSVHKGLRQHYIMDIDDRRQVTLRTDLPNQPHDLARGLGIETGGGVLGQEETRGLVPERGGATTPAASRR